MDNFRQLKYLDALTTYGNVGAAAEKLGVTKSTLSQAVSRLEYVYGVPLFVRDRQGIRPTVYGELLVDVARCFGHQVGRLLRLWKSDTVADAFEPGEEHDKAINAERDGLVPPQAMKPSTTPEPR